ncbi:hypothetical protein CANARDRAFT_10164 [[Candida] arabinofermentans NRRL YB-2248]|uniref:Mitochondrial carrier protein n=1 Tax=[Candida] arabinofermentans NRRL YB-2248 TaxID=983967 RepID=A0A1E4STX5_9ASCO|nr:hypothetical protein CANARDRAFT_10164 [[Candida] arabinofermentans NRRL YB-2248]
MNKSDPIPPVPPSISNHIPAITGDIIPHPNPIIQLPAILTPYKSAILSYSASIVSTTVGFPLDSMKTRMQTHHFPNAYTCFKLTLQQEGFTGLFRGISAPLISSSLARSIGVAMYTEVKPIVSQISNQLIGVTPLINNAPGGSIKQQHFEKVINNIPIALVSGSISGFFVSCFACPFELTKIFSQILVLVNHDNGSHSGNFKKDTSIILSDDKKIPKGLIQVGKSIAKHQGITGLYSGFRYHFLRDGLSTGLFYGVYETVKLLIQSKNDQFFNDHCWERQFIDLVSVPFAGAFAGCLSWITVFPLDTVKSQYQRDVVGNVLKSIQGNHDKKVVIVHPSLKSFLTRLPKREMYKGLGPSLTRSVTTTMIFFSIFEYLMNNIV